MPTSSKVSVPLKLDAFVFNPAVCGETPDAQTLETVLPDAKIAPITQPNYTFLRLKDFLVQNDIQEHIDLHNAAPAENNPRLRDLGKATTRINRLGVYLHWMIPRFYRSGVADSPSATQPPGKNLDPGKEDLTAPRFRRVPNRWLVIRILDPNAPTTKPAQSGIESIKAWVIESDLMRSIDDLDVSVDLQVDVSPFLTSQGVTGSDGISIEQQAEIFIGYREDARTWKEGKVGDEIPGAKRADLSLLNSSNQLFADFQPHCGNVFSTLDTFGYGLNEENHLTAAVASYYVIGWHSDANDDPFFTGDGTTHEQRLKDLNMTLNAQKEPPPDVTAWLNASESTQALCHGAMYNVEWNAEQKPKKMPADECSHMLNKGMPVAVGTTSMDSLLAYIEAHRQGGSELEEDLYKLRVLLRAQDDGVEAQRAAADEVQNWNFSRASGGTYWHIPADPGDKNIVPPSEAEALALKNLNQAQDLLDGTMRMLQQLRWNMFSLWWKYVSDVNHSNAISNIDSSALTTRLQKLNSLATNQWDKIKALKEGGSFRRTPTQAVRPEFFQQRDPTLLVAGVNAGWPWDFLELLKVRLDSQIISKTTSTDPLFGVGCLPAALRDAGASLVGEFMALRPGTSLEIQPTQFYPLYHDQGDPANNPKPEDPWRDRWESTQPWFPLFLEWEAEYTHIPFDYWDVNQHTARLFEHPKYRYGILEDKTIYDPGPPPVTIKDIRIASGRILILPQPIFDLQAQITRLFSTTPEDLLNSALPPEKQKELLADLHTLHFLSSPLDGFTDHLLTVSHGSHIKPNARMRKQALQPIPDAVKASSEGGMKEDQLQWIDKESDLTPYGFMVSFLGEDYSAFKPVTHGQFRFTKLNIIDKFGQAVHAIDPSYHPTGPQAVYPCISEYYEPQVYPPGHRDAGQPKIVGPREADGFCEFMQVPPQINQPTRLNSAFVVRNEESTSAVYWRPATEWENPIWGWLVVNYVDYGIQIFLPDGTFYREVRLAAPNSSAHVAASPNWLPFGPPKGPTNTGQLDRLLEKLTNKEDETYLLAFLDMIINALDRAPSAPSAYSKFVSSLVGKPLALVNAGFSLELAADAKVNQSSQEGQKGRDPDRSILYNGPEPTNPKDRDKQYFFSVKLGDEQRTSDGLVGYFDALPSPAPGNELNLDTLYTYFHTPSGPPPGPKNPIHLIDKPPYPILWPFYTPPDDKDPANYALIRNSQWSVFGTIMDPFLPLSAYSGILPIKSLSLPSWTWESALNRMTAFFHMGPLIVPTDVPRFEEKNRLKSNYGFVPPAKDQTVEGSEVGMPALPVADWCWLQPYWVGGEGEKEGDNRGAEEEGGKGGSAFMALGLGKVDNRPKFEKGPYTALEGYLQMKTAITGDGPKS
ncbi:hypothetical protein FGG08_004951 [Glutinoglossum americanum]|uniref:Uncharacterized protein n=1 Tax=Glutinoglossum americanum TaxID=1670608 RepID=A0A9P8KZ04_9PEZI|nr:hypothetical protein FGG08_004951 [Glutinoglossum americanum]